MIKKVKKTVPSAYFISDLDRKETVETFNEKALQTTNKRKCKIEKGIKNTKAINLMLHEKAIIVPLTVGLIKKIYYK